MRRKFQICIHVCVCVSCVHVSSLLYAACPFSAVFCVLESFLVNVFAVTSQSPRLPWARKRSAVGTRTTAAQGPLPRHSREAVRPTRARCFSSCAAKLRLLMTHLMFMLKLMTHEDAAVRLQTAKIFATRHNANATRHNAKNDHESSYHRQEA